MDATVKGYLQTVYNQALVSMQNARGVTAPALDAVYAYTDTISEKLDTFWEGVDLSSDINAEISLIQGEYSTSALPTVPASPTPVFVLSRKDASNLQQALGDVAPVTGATPDQTVFVLPSLAEFSQIPLPVLPAFTGFTDIPVITNQYSSAYLAAIDTYVSQINSNIPIDLINKEAERLDFELREAVKDVMATTAAKGFRLPNSMTSRQLRATALKHFTRIEAISKEYTDAVLALIKEAQSIGVSVEQLRMDFTAHINKITAELGMYTVERYKDLLEWEITNYKARTEQQLIQINASRSKIMLTTYDIKKTLLDIAVASQKNTITTDKANNLVQFARMYEQANSDWLQEQIDQSLKDQFREKSLNYRDISDLTALKKEHDISVRLTAANKDVVLGKLNILAEDIKAYTQLTDAMDLEVAGASAVWQDLLTDFKAKIAAMGVVDSAIEGAAAVASAAFDADILVQKGVA